MTKDRRIDQFGERLDALGPDFSMWPHESRAEANRLVATSAQARRLHDEARRLSALVAEAAESEVPNGFAFRVVADVAARRTDRLGWLAGTPRRFGVASVSFCAAALAIGIALGAITQPAQAGDQDGDFGFTISDGGL